MELRDAVAVFSRFAGQMAQSVLNACSGQDEDTAAQQGKALHLTWHMPIFGSAG